MSLPNSLSVGFAASHRPVDGDDLNILVALSQRVEDKRLNVIRAPTLVGGPVPEIDPPITHLTLRNCRHINSKAIIKFVKKMYRIKYLDLRGCPVTNSAVNAIAQHCLYLEALFLPVTEAITDVSLLTLFTRCQRLHTIHMGGSSGITDDVVQRMAERGDFDCYAEWKVASRGSRCALLGSPSAWLRRVCACVCGLQSVAFTQCPSLTDSLLSRLFGGAKANNIEEVTLSSCTGLTEMALIGLANAAESSKPSVR